MIKTEILEDGRIHTYSSVGNKILQVDTGVVYDDAADVIEHEYEETDEVIDAISSDESSSEYQQGYDQAVLDLIEQGVL